MAVAKTGALFKALTFDGYSSRNYGIYITGEAVYNAPEHDVEMVTIPGRNGAFALDHERFENIEVTYPAGIFADNEEDFADGISSFRNMLCSRQGYCVLQDEYHPDEYRLAVYKSGLEVTPTQLKAGEFDITFNCKPQRFLTTGDTAVAVANNGTITNPTLFDAKPQLQVWGYGNINVNGYDITIENETLGDILLFNSAQNVTEISDTLTSMNSKLNNGDLIYTNKVIGICDKPYSDFSPKTVSSKSVGTEIITATNMSYGSVSCTWNVIPTTPVTGRIRFVINGLSFNYGSGGSLEVKVPVTFTFTDSSTQVVNFCFRVKETSVSPNWALKFESTTTGTYTSRIASIDEVRGVSTISALGSPTYIDCDIGEAYLISGSEIISLDRLIDLGSRLPVLSSGSNTITYDNTITSFKVVPRWWKI